MSRKHGQGGASISEGPAESAHMHLQIDIPSAARCEWHAAGDAQQDEP
jgi:hypothetical protein